MNKKTFMHARNNNILFRNFDCNKLIFDLIFDFTDFQFNFVQSCSTFTRFTLGFDDDASECVGGDIAEVLVLLLLLLTMTDDDERIAVGAMMLSLTG